MNRNLQALVMRRSASEEHDRYETTGRNQYYCQHRKHGNPYPTDANTGAKDGKHQLASAMFCSANPSKTEAYVGKWSSDWMKDTSCLSTV